MSKSSMMRVIGLMSGTSMDGIDIALIETDGEEAVEPLGCASLPYDAPFRARLRQAIEDATTIVERAERPGILRVVERELTERHAAAVADFLRTQAMTPRDIDLVSFHGQTVVHRPCERLTVQIGDGPLLAQLIGVDVVHELRARDVAAGGQGAPLAPVYHRAMAAKIGGGPMAVLNIGGVANVTFIDRDGELLAFDTGPGNALLDDFVFARTGRGLDADGVYSAPGTVDAALLETLMRNAYFAAPPPKSLDRNHFAVGDIGHLSVEDGAATLAAFTVEAVAAAAHHASDAPRRWIVCGGGRRNPTITKGLRERLTAAVVTAEEVGFDGDAVEAQAWAYLGVRSMHGRAISFPGTTGVARAMTGGVISKKGAGDPEARNDLST